MRPKMSRAQRAKQFMPYAALKGYDSYLKKAERRVVPRREVAPDRAEELNRKLCAVKPEDMVTVTWFCRGEYLRMTGMLVCVDMAERYLQIVNVRIPFADIYDIE